MFAVAVAIVAQAAVFEPPLGEPLRIVTERVLTDETGSNRFRVERVVRFSREGIGYRAELRVLSATGEGSSDPSAMFEIGYSALIGRTLVFHLDGAGHAVAVDGQAALWADFCSAIARIIAEAKSKTPAEREVLATRIAAPLKAFPAERQLSTLASLFDGMIAEAPQSGAERRLRLTARSPFGGTVTLEGTHRASRKGGALHGVTRASAPVTAPAEGDASARSGDVVLLREVDSEPTTGLIDRSVETITTRLDGEEGPRQSTRITTITVTRDTPWPAAAN